MEECLMEECLALLGCEVEWPIILSNRLKDSMKHLVFENAESVVASWEMVGIKDYTKMNE
ncbi:unnamed protein product [Sphenostylis stenocarpa]|uniref:Uncharacterized protein n=1 Tax=Sphenostylis stenocarpa TaxID=92480 RepID=A0AA86VYX0_9FABA|nr:unnamed protein product [Sphenostylis stenocarpa]